MKRYRGFTLWETMSILLLFGLFLGLAFWGMRAQFSARQRIAEHAHRHGVMRAILNHLRRDMAEASIVKMIPGGVELTSPDGLTRYRVEVIEVNWNFEATTMPPPPPVQTLVRIAPDGELKTWSMFGQTIQLASRMQAGADANVGELDVAFETRLRFDTGTEMVRRFKTTLRVGGAQ